MHSFFSIMKNVIKNQKLNFPEKLCDIQKKCQRTKLFVSKRSKNLILTIFCYNRDYI